MIRKSISRSKHFAALSERAQVLFCIMIPHLNGHGKMNGEPNFVKGEVCPLLKWATVQAIGRALLEISSKTQVKWFVDGKSGLRFIHALDWKDHQDVREDRLGDDFLPDYSGRLPDKSSIEVEVEVEGEVKVQPSTKKAPDGSLPDKSGSEQTNGHYNPKTPLQEVVLGFKLQMGVKKEDREWDKVYFPRFSKPAKGLLTLFSGDVDKCLDCIEGIATVADRKRLSWTPETVVKHASDWREKKRLFE